MTTSAPPGWYPDPHGAPVNRYFDGNQWTAAIGPIAQTPAQQPGRVTIHYGFALLAFFSLVGTLLFGLPPLFSGDGGWVGVLWLMWGGMWTIVWTAFAINHTLKSRS
ncbi:DUF2510 domain-containing protein [Mycolicibacterium llatzerense]|uniref:DUF2510 domain-containing protein n=1 Tax=Mycolicibacterium llatzerense TaxID=280871 RepID=UPI0021B68596|nr:DUF2510 domain-containing protein [Mycolicibacterium llatzerense]MCT7365628.1 hypothetical protein [Mycolicibacterium llatzerense]